VNERFVDQYDLVILDLDGVVYLVDRPIPTAVSAIARLHADGRPVAFATNNASRSADEVAELLTGMGVPARPDEVLTSAAAAATLLAERLAPFARVLVVGADALRAEIRTAGLTPVSEAAHDPVAVVQGYGPQVGWSDLAEAAVAIRDGALWVATNTDRTLPSARGPLPGNGALVAALRTALNRGPDVVVGKPEPALFMAAARRAGASRPLVVGDRLDTDIEGAVRAGLDSVLVLTGVTTPSELLAAPPPRRPTYVASDLSGLFDVDGPVRLPAQDGSDGGWTVSGDPSVLTGNGRALDALAALSAAVWRSPGVQVAAGSPAARATLNELGLPATQRERDRKRWRP
jgi:glycerol-1-phosphatase